MEGSWPESQPKGAFALEETAMVLLRANCPFQFRQTFLVRVTKDEKHQARVRLCVGWLGSLQTGRMMAYHV